jgi:hypothetical protein
LDLDTNFDNSTLPKTSKSSRGNKLGEFMKISQNIPYTPSSSGHFDKINYKSTHQTLMDLSENNFLSACETGFTEDVIRLNKIRQVENEAPRLVLEVLCSPVLREGMRINILPKGIEDSLRNEDDGIVYFGTCNDIVSHLPQLNDFLINDEKNKMYFN